MPSNYSVLFDQFEKNIRLEEDKRIRYFKAPDGPRLRLHYESHKDFDPGVLSLLLAGYCRLFSCDLALSSIGYGTYQVSYTVIAKTKEEAEKIARHMNNSRRIATLTEHAVSTELVVRTLSENARLRDALLEFEKLASEANVSNGGSSNSETIKSVSAEIDSVLAVAESDLGIGSDSELSKEKRLARLDEAAVKQPPDSNSSYWRVGDAIGAIMGGLIKSLGGG